MGLFNKNKDGKKKLNLALQAAMAYCDVMDIKYTIPDDSTDRMVISYNGLDNMDELYVIIVFDEDNSACVFYTFNYIEFSDDKKTEMIYKCNEMNNEYRWVKFYVDESDNTVTIQGDAVIQLKTCGEEVMEIVFRIVTIGDEAYPKFKALL